MWRKLRQGQAFLFLWDMPVPPAPAALRMTESSHWSPLDPSFPKALGCLKADGRRTWGCTVHRPAEEEAPTLARDGPCDFVIIVTPVK